jgi:glycine/D-amino acid oxidase-like deaminating enzyme
MRVVIIGGGVAGLLAAHSFITRGIRPTLFEESDVLGGQWATFSGTKFVHFVPRREHSITKLVEALGLSFELQPVRGGVLIELVGVNERFARVDERLVLPHPDCLHWPVIGNAIRRAHWEKTRFNGTIEPNSMNNDKFSRGYRPTKLSISPGVLLDELISGVREGADIHLRRSVRAVSESEAVTTNTRTPFDLLVSAVPLWSFKSIYHGRKPIPNARAHRLMLRTYDAPSFTEVRGLDYLYTPSTQFGMIHRVSSDALSGRVTVEANRRHRDPDHDVEALMRDVGSLLGHDAKLVDKAETHGHLIPIREPWEYPDRIVPIGRFAQWDSRATFDKVFERAEAIAEKATR